MPFHDVQHRFADAARNSRVAQYLLNHAGPISAVSYMAGNIGLFVKNGVDVNLETGAGLLYTASSVAIWWARENPKAMKIAGIFLMAAAGVFGLSAVGKPGFEAQVIGLIPPFAGGYLMMLAARDGEKPDLQNSSERGFLQRHPTLVSGLVQSLARPMLMLAAGQRNDVPLMMIAVVWAVGDMFLAATDRNLQKTLKPVQEPTGPNP